jgi:hypothetical protein
MTANAISCCLMALTLTALVTATDGDGDVETQDVTAARKAAHAAAPNEAIAWAGHTAELVNIGLTVREYTIVTVAMFEAANAVTGRYEPYILRPTAEANTSIDAAVATAAHRALSVVWPRDSRVWDALYELSLSRVTDEAARSAGVRLGRSAADGIVSRRSKDVAFPGPQDEPRLGVGMWRPNAPELTPTQAGRYALLLGLPPITAYLHWSPWTLDARAQFRPGPPPSVDSVEYARDFNEVKTLGGFHSVRRTADQTAEALFFMTPAPRIFGPFANHVASLRGLDVTDASRLQALLALALTDAQIACWDAKFAYRQWRPLTAIREAATDGNAATEPDQHWIPMVPTPPFPDYPAAHACSAGAAAAVLAQYIRPGERLALTSPATGIPAGSGETRQYSDLEAVKTSVANARVFAGVHFRRSSDAGAEIGDKVGRQVLQKFLKPTSKPS